MTHIHWIGAGLSSAPGIRRLAKLKFPMTVWNRTVQKAYDVFDGALPVSVSVKEFSFDGFPKILNAGEIVVSMLPANFHPELAELCLKKKSHLVTTSYVSETMQNLGKSAKEAGLSFVNEAGLDPGLDHLLARELFWRYQGSENFSRNAILSFHSYCGGFPVTPGKFCYKFSWSPIGVLRALKSPVKYIKDSQTVTNPKPWKELFLFNFFGEGFEVYPNRDSCPYLQEYGFDNATVDFFMRGTLRPKGWAKAWEGIFQNLETADENWLKTKSDELWQKYAYEQNEKDRVVLTVSLTAKENSKTTWSESLSIDETGSGKDTAMARLVSWPASFAVEMICEGSAPRGVSAATKDRNQTQTWLKKLIQEGSKVFDHKKNSLYK